ncbi:unknown [Sinorhizobium phage PBC5]|nr:unknown [Sinorhizobium phage PBC5]
MLEPDCGRRASDRGVSEGNDAFRILALDEGHELVPWLKTGRKKRRRSSIAPLKLSGRVRVLGGGVDRDHAVVAVVEAGLLHAVDHAGCDDRFVAVILRLFGPGVAEAACGAESDNASLTAHEQGSTGRNVVAGAIVTETDRCFMAVQDGVVDHAKATLEDGVASAFRRSSRLLDFQPAALVVVAQVMFLERVHDADVVRFAVDHQRHHVGVLRIPGRHHAGLDLRALDHGAAHLVGGVDRGLSSRVAAVEDVSRIRRLNRVCSMPGPSRIFDEVFVDAARAGEVDENHLVVELRPVVRQAVLADLAHVVRGALAGHLATGGNAVAHLIDLHLVGEELQTFLFALESLVAVGRLILELNREIVGDGVAGFRFEIGEALDAESIIGADELAVEIALPRDVDEERAGPLLLGLCIAKGDNSLSHECQTPIGIVQHSCAVTALNTGIAGLLQ